MLQNISPAKADTYFEHGKLTDWRTTLGPLGPPPPDNNNVFQDVSMKQSSFINKQILDKYFQENIS